MESAATIEAIKMEDVLRELGERLAAPLPLPIITGLTQMLAELPEDKQRWIRIEWDDARLERGPPD